MFDPENANDLANQIKVIMNPEVRKMLAENGKAKTDLQFEIEHHFDEPEKLFA